MKIKLKDLTKEQYDEWRVSHCIIEACDVCPFYFVNCISSKNICSWINHKNLYSEEFLNQEVEVEVDILDEVEKEYLENILRPFKTRKIVIEKKCYGESYEFIKIFIYGVYSDEIFTFPLFEKDSMYKNMELYKYYTPEELGLFKK